MARRAHRVDMVCRCAGHYARSAIGNTAAALQSIDDHTRPAGALQQITEAQKASGFNISAFALGVVEKILQPLVGIAFVVLYLDSKLELPSHPEAIVRPNEGDAVR